MGWIFQRQKLTRETPVEYFKRELSFSRDGISATVLDAACVGSAVYAAVRMVNASDGTDYVFCAVVLVKNNGRNGFGYKKMDESTGPYEAACPNRIMPLLSIVEAMPHPGFAAARRERVATAKALKNRKKREAPTRIAPKELQR